MTTSYPPRPSTSNDSMASITYKRQQIKRKQFPQTQAQNFEDAAIANFTIKELRALNDRVLVVHCLAGLAATQVGKYCLGRRFAQSLCHKACVTHLSSRLLAKLADADLNLSRQLRIKDSRLGCGREQSHNCTQQQDNKSSDPKIKRFTGPSVTTAFHTPPQNDLHSNCQPARHTTEHSCTLR